MSELEEEIKKIFQVCFESWWSGESEKEAQKQLLYLIEEEKSKSYNKGLRLNYYLDEEEVLKKFAEYVENKPVSVESHYDEFDSDTISMNKLIDEYLGTLKK